jgi:hypothetical protein
MSIEAREELVMGATIQQEPGNVRVLRIMGLLTKAELDAALATEVGQWGPATRVKVLVIVEDFKGWERGVDWGDLTFFLEHDKEIDKIAIVADPKWETEFLMFAGAGLRLGPVKFFPPNQLVPARDWLG